MAELRNISEEEKLKRRLLMTHTDRFRLLMELYRIGKKMKVRKPQNKPDGHA